MDHNAYNKVKKDIELVEMTFPELEKFKHNYNQYKLLNSYIHTKKVSIDTLKESLIEA
jgi:hypothetical protein